MSNFWPRWRYNEMRLQAFIELPKYEKAIKDANQNAGKPPKPVSIIIPTTQAVVSTITTYMTHTFTGQHPIMTVGSYKDETIDRARNMEMVLQYNADHVRLIRWWAQGFQDWQTYGFAAWRVGWKDDYRIRTRKVQKERYSDLGVPEVTEERVRQRVKIYEGNTCVSQDPAMFFPDPTVPLCEAAEKGEYVFWRTFEGRHSLLHDEAEGVLKWVQAIPTEPLQYASDLSVADPDLIRGENPGGSAFPGVRYRTGTQLRGRTRIDQGTCIVIPRELGIGESERPEMWLFTIGNAAQIIQAEPVECDHGYHPVSVTEPLGMGYSFGSAGMVDFISPLQDAISWLYNSHQANVRKSINNDLIIDPSLIVMKDLKTPDDGGARLIRLKQSAIGTDVRNAIQQLPVQDVTRGHITDMQVLFEIIQRISGASDNFQGVQDSGGRKTATEIRTAMAAAASRLAYLVRIVSAQAIVPQTEMMALNNMQYLSDEFYLMLTGRDGAKAPVRLTPDDISGDFYFPVHDGTLPIDRVALVDVWKEVLRLLLESDGLGGKYDVGKVFEYTAELAGAKNIENMRVQQVPDEQVQDQAQAGNLVPLDGGMMSPGGMMSQLSGALGAQNSPIAAERGRYG